LDSLVAAARTQPSWNFAIEGHTDNTGSDAHNQTLSEKRTDHPVVLVISSALGRVQQKTAKYNHKSK
jgi:flagellar motor protein MotB